MRLSHFKKTAAVIALGLGLVQFAKAQDATVNVSGFITANTCTLQVSEGSNSSTTALSVDFGKVVPTGTFTAVGTPLSAPRTVTFTARNAGNTGNCVATTVTGDRVNYNVLLGMTSPQIFISSTLQTYRKNDIVGGTDAVLAIGRGTTVTPATPLPLSINAGTATGTFASAAGVPIGNGTTPASIQVTAQLVTANSATPTAGAFSASIPLFLVYQ